MLKAINPDTISAPRRHYVHSIQVPPGCQLVSVSGQVAVAPDGSIPISVVAQTEICWRNIIDILEANDMTVNDIVKVTQFLTRVDDRDAHMATRDRFLGAHKPTSTLLFVSALAEPNFLVEVEVWAAKQI